jgi:5-(carboxyamino)imidazole ribonucleotide synthase
MFDTTKKIGILGGGQLGKMLGIAAANWDFNIHILDKADCPASLVCQSLTVGDYNNYENVLDFGRKMDLITIEIEHVNTQALHQLVKEGKTVHPNPIALDLIKDKGLQKEFYIKNNLPTAKFQLFENEKAVINAVKNSNLHFPFVQKTRTAGYDGKGVTIIKNQHDLENKLLKGACLTEDLVPIKAEIAVIAARNERDEVTIFPAVEMEFHPEANLVEFLICPARISTLIAAQAEALAEQVIRAFDVCGLLAVELFLTPDNELIINEVAPRPHNSGHHTIDSAYISQYQQHLLAINNLSMGDTAQKQPAVMLNLLGEEGHIGKVKYEGVENCLALGGVNVHLYGKKTTSPYRKMGHVTIVADNLEVALKKANFVKQNLKVVSF